MNRSRHIAFRAPLCVILGALTAVSVAASLSFASRLTFAGSFSLHIRMDTNTWGVRYSRGFGILRACSSPVFFSSSWVLDDESVAVSDREHRFFADLVRRRAARIDREGRNDLLLGMYTWLDETSGWPFPALRSDIECFESQIGAIASGFSGGFPLIHATPPSNPRIPADRLAAIPFIPIWQGLLADSALFALLWAAPLFLLPGLRRRHRRRRGLCPSCAYDLAGLPPDAAACPECGAPRVGSAPSQE